MKFITKESKPGPGIPENAPEKRRFFLFFEILGVKFFKLMKLNFIYLLCLSPLIAAICFSFKINPDIHSFADLGRNNWFTYTPDPVNLILLVISMFITGPATAGFVFVLRNMQRREHTWVFSDFFVQFKRNYFKAMIVGALDIVVYLLLYLAFSFYLFYMPDIFPEMGMICGLAAGIVGVIFFIYTWAHFYIYTIMVTFDLKLKHIIKNSVIFAFAKLPLNVLITLIICAVILGMLYLLAFISILFVVVFALIAVSFIGLVIVFSTYTTIDTLMLKRVQEKEEGGRVLNTRG